MYNICFLLRLNNSVYPFLDIKDKEYASVPAIYADMKMGLFLESFLYLCQDYTLKRVSLDTHFKCLQNHVISNIGSLYFSQFLFLFDFLNICFIFEIRMQLYYFPLSFSPSKQSFTESNFG